MTAEQSAESRLSGWRIAAALLVSLVVATYMIGVVIGRIPKDQRLDGIDVAVLGLALLAVFVMLQPNILARLRLLQVKGFKVELLERVRERQLQHEVELEDIRLVIPLLLPDAEQKHLRHLASGAVTTYKGSSPLRGELRRLRSMDLLQSKENRAVADIKDDALVNLSDFVELTELGRRWARRLAKLEEPRGDEPRTTTIA